MEAELSCLIGESCWSVYFPPHRHTQHPLPTRRTFFPVRCDAFPLFQGYEDQDNVYFVQDIADSEEFVEVLRVEFCAGYSEQLVCDSLRGVLEALTYVHALGGVHGSSSTRDASHEP